jgi:hypothetical protein
MSVEPIGPVQHSGLYSRTASSNRALTLEAPRRRAYAPDIVVIVDDIISITGLPARDNLTRVSRGEITGINGTKYNFSGAGEFNTGTVCALKLSALRTGLQSIGIVGVASVERVSH